MTLIAAGAAGAVACMEPTVVVLWHLEEMTVLKVTTRGCDLYLYVNFLKMNLRILLSRAKDRIVRVDANLMPRKISLVWLAAAAAHPRSAPKMSYPYLYS
jgi:hypothetical protein